MSLGFLFAFLLGLAIGSFLNVLIWRIPRNEPIGATRSYCPNCKKELRWYELIPTASFVWQGGKCRSCHTRISLQYPIVEFATGILFVFVFSQFTDLLPQLFSNVTIPSLVNLLYLFFISSVLIVIFVTDFRYYIIPDKITFPAIGAVLIYNLFRNFEHSNFEFVWNLPLNFVERASPLLGGDLRSLALNQFFGPLFAGFFVSAFFLSLVLVSKGKWMGLGDVKFAFLMGLILGFPNIFVALFLAFTLGSLVGILLMGAGKKTLQSQLPFGTFLTLATFTSLFWGDKIFNWYWNVIL